MKSLKKINVFLICLIVFVSPVHSNAITFNIPDITLFVPHEYWLSKVQAEKVIGLAKKTGIDAVAINVWHGRGVTWKSNIAPFNKIIKTNNTDPLKSFIDLAKRNNISVIAVFSVSHRSKNVFPWFVKENGINKAYNLHNAKFRNLMVSMIKEVILGYDIDGINLDYIRTKGICSSEMCKNNYNKKTKRSLFLDKKTYKYNDTAKESIIKWNSYPVELILSEITKTLKNKPGISLSVASHPGYEGFKLQGADSIKWLNNGDIDYIYSMNYQKYNNLPVEKLKSIINQLNDPSGLVLTIGNFEKNNSKSMKDISSRKTDHFLKLVNFAKYFNEKNKGKYAIFTYRFMNQDQAQLLMDIHANQQ